MKKLLLSILAYAIVLFVFMLLSANVNNSWNLNDWNDQTIFLLVLIGGPTAGFIGFLTYLNCK